MFPNSPLKIIWYIGKHGLGFNSFLLILVTCSYIKYYLETQWLKTTIFIVSQFQEVRKPSEARLCVLLQVTINQDASQDYYSHCKIQLTKGPLSSSLIRLLTGLGPQFYCGCWSEAAFNSLPLGSFCSTTHSIAAWFIRANKQEDNRTNGVLANGSQILVLSW